MGEITNRACVVYVDEGVRVTNLSNSTSFFVLKSQQPKILCVKKRCLCCCSNCKNYYPEELVIETTSQTNI